MSIQPPSNLYSQGNGSHPQSVEVPVIEIRPPASNDNKYPIGKRWIDRQSQQSYTLVRFDVVNGDLVASWIVDGVPAGGTLDALVDATGDVVVANLSNQIIFPSGNGVTTVGSGSNMTVNMHSPFTGGEFLFTDSIVGSVRVAVTNTSAVTGSDALVQISTVSSGGSAFVATQAGPSTPATWLTGVSSVDGTWNMVYGGAFTSSPKYMSVSNTGVVTVPNSLDAGAGPFLTPGSNIIPVQAAGSTAGHTVVMAVTNNDNTNAASHAAFLVTTGGTSGGDPYIGFQGPSTTWASGTSHVDASFNISNGSSPSGGSSKIKIATTGAITFDGAYTFPIADGTANQVLTTSGGGAVTWGPAQTAFTAAIEGATTAGTATYTKQYATYCRVGNVITFQINLSWTGHTGTGDMLVTGFPFVFAISGANFPLSTVVESITLPAGAIGVSAVGTSSKTTASVACSVSAAVLSPVVMSAAGTIAITGSYLTGA